METGFVKWFNNSKFYGLIISDIDGSEIPVHRYEEGCLLEGQRVKYVKNINNDEPFATNLKIIDSSYKNSIKKDDNIKETILHDYPRISIYDNVLSSDYCDDLITRSLDPNYVGEYITMDHHREDCDRDTYGQANDKNIYRRILNDFHYKDYDIITTAAAKALGRPYCLFESADILYYQKGHYMTAHHDYPYNPRKLEYYQKAGTREAVALIYLNDNFLGGETYFPHLGIKITPKKGSMSIWTHTGDNELDWSLMHESLEVTQGEKFAIIFCLSSLPRTESQGH